jgi:hypothetical protein
MARRLEIGPVGYVKAIGAATQSLTPLSDRSILITSIRITAPSADDTWTLNIASKDVAWFRVDTVAHNSINSAPSASSPANRDFWTWAEHVIGKPVSYPLPNGQVATVSSVGGATADISIEFEEHDKLDMSHSTLLNHYGGKKYRMPIWAYLAAAAATATEIPFDTQISPAFVPKIFTGTQIQAGYEVDIHALFIEGAGVNSYNSSTDQRAITDHVYAIVNSQRLFTRVPYTSGASTATSQDGIPCVGTAAATGSGNSVYGADLERFPAFQVFREDNSPIINPAIHLGPGATSSWGYGFTGVFTNTKAFSHARLLALCDVTVL